MYMHVLSSAGATLSLATLLVAQAPCWETSLGTNLGLTDESYASNLSLGFTFNFGGVPYTAITVCSNGYIWMGSGAPNSLLPDYLPSTANLNTQGPRLAPLWMDFDPSVTGNGGNVWFNTFAATATRPARAVITWNGVYQFPGTGPAATPLSMQVQLLDTGDFFYHYDANMSVVIGGFGIGNSIIGASDGVSPGNVVDFLAPPIVTASPTATQEIARGNFPFVGHDLDWIPAGNGYAVTIRTQCGQGSYLRYGQGCPTLPVSLDAAPGSVPAIGTTFTLAVSQIPGGTILGAMVLSFVQQNTALDALGMPGCWQLLSLDVASSLQVNAGLAALSLPIPSNQALLGVRLFGQAATFSPGVNALGVATSNGVELHLGY
jgi:hypothetical protein